MCGDSYTSVRHGSGGPPGASPAILRCAGPSSAECLIWAPVVTNPADIVAAQNGGEARALARPCFSPTGPRARPPPRGGGARAPRPPWPRNPPPPPPLSPHPPPPPP